MKKRCGYSLSVDDGTLRVTGVAPAADTPYRIETVAGFAAPGADAAVDARLLAEPRLRVVQQLPDDQVHLMTAVMPALKSRALAAAVQGVVARQQGGRPGDWIARAMPLPAAGGRTKGTADYVVVYTPLDLAREKFADAQALGCRPLGQLPDYLALDELYRRHGLGDDEAGPWNLVHLGDEGRFLCVGDEHGLLFSRPLPEDLSGGAAREEYLERLVTEIERSTFFAQQAERSMIVGRFVVCGQPDLVDDLVERLAARTEAGVRPWRAEELFTAESGLETWRYLPHLARAAAALHGPACEILPPGAKPHPLRAVRRHAAVALAGFVTVAVPMLLVGGVLTARVQSEYLRRAADRTEELYERAGLAAADYLQNRALRDRQLNMDELADGQRDLAGLLSDLAERTPADVVYDGLELARDDSLGMRMTLRGQSLGRTGETAQEVFLGFHGGLASYERLVELREPVYLEISGVEDARRPRSRVAFTLEYAVRGEVTR